MVWDWYDEAKVVVVCVCVVPEVKTILVVP